MQSTTYFLLEDSDRPVIIHGETGLRLNIFHLENEAFQPTEGELHLFGDEYGDFLAFETEGYNRENLDIFQGAVLWYARYLDYPGMKISANDPRPGFKRRNL